MVKINDLLLLNFEEDIKKVIDVEDQSESEIKYEIDNYIITQNIADHFSKFFKTYKSSIKETGVWISGFYGSGKSYFGKNLGHVLTNKNILGTEARERFIQRLAGLKNTSLLENDIRSLDSIKSRVIFMDAAKQYTGDGGFAWTLFKNFLKSFGFLDNNIGFIEFSFFLKDEYEWFLQQVSNIKGQKWNEIKKDPFVPVTFRQIMLEAKFSEKEYDDLKSNVDYTIKNFDAGQLRDHLKLYFSKFPDDRIVFILDEASEAVAQKKFTLLDLEGISEALSSMCQKVWTIAIAQEKLDDVINNANVSRSNLVKVTDRFKTSIHLESTDVEYIVKERLLKKKDEKLKSLISFYSNNIGKISDLTNLSAAFITRTDTQDDFVTYYPFHKYQFRLLQNFLFKSNILAKTQIAERGMIITTFDVLRKRLIQKSLFEIASSSDIASEGQLTPPIELIRRYDKAKKKLIELNSNVDGELLLKVIHFLTESGEVTATLDNITKCYVTNIEEDYFQLKSQIEKALKELVDLDTLIVTNSIYKISTDQEQKLINEMKSIFVEDYFKKNNLVKLLKNITHIKSFGNILLDRINYPFSVQTDQEDDLSTTSSKYLIVKVYSLYNIDKEWNTFVENIKLVSSANHNTIYIIPQKDSLTEIDKLIVEVYRYTKIDDEYSKYTDNDVRKIIKVFSGIKETKEGTLDGLIKNAYLNGVAIYHSEEVRLSESEFKSKINSFQTRLINNIFSKRLSSSINEETSKIILKEKNPKNLNEPFRNINDFNFFDNNGNFIGDHLKVVEEVTSGIKKTYLDGKSLEEMLSGPPWGYPYGVINATLAVLFRSGKLIIKYNGTERFDYTDSDVHKVFISSTDFRRSSFKYITKTLSSSDKNDVIQVLIDIKAKDIINKEIGYNTNDFELIDSITQVSVKLIEDLHSLKRNTPEFETYFTDYVSLVDFLKQFTEKTTESNYLDKADLFLQKSSEFVKTVKKFKSIQQFVNKKLPHAKQYMVFVTSVVSELEKIGGSYKKNIIYGLADEFKQLFQYSLSEKFAEIEKKVQQIKDEYYNMFKSEHEKMAVVYNSLLENCKNTLLSIKEASEELNTDLTIETNTLIDYTNKRICNRFDIGYEHKCKSCNFSMSEAVTAVENAENKLNILFSIQTRIKKDKDTPERKPVKIKFKLCTGIITVGEYKKQLQEKLNEINTMNPSDKIDLDIQIEGK